MLLVRRGAITLIAHGFAPGLDQLLDLVRLVGLDRLLPKYENYVSKCREMKTEEGFASVLGAVQAEADA